MVSSGGATFARVQEALRYDPLSGALYWRVCAARRVVVGEEAGCVNRFGYRVVRLDNRLYRAHRLAWLLSYGEWPQGDLDHVNGLRDDNRLRNLREVGRAGNAQNIRNARPQSKTGVLGVSVHRGTGRYRAAISYPGTPSKHLGLFDTVEEASAAYLAAKRVLHLGNTL